MNCKDCGKEMIYDPEDEMWVCPDALMTDKVYCGDVKK